MLWCPGLFYTAIVVFLASAAAVLFALERQQRWLAMLAALGMAVAAVLFLLSAFLPRKRVDWERIRAEQRLWESGPLGRRWLRVRRRLEKMWKL
jgi:hypothetical protein